jgi:Zn finger protein HypA/HybF involved in hydrogenase expression
MEKLGNVLIQVMQDLSKVSTNGSAHVKVNQQLCTPRQFEVLFNYFTQGTILERIDVDVDPLQSEMSCSCGESQVIEGDHNGYKRCPACGRFAEIQDDSYQLVHPDPKKVSVRQSIRF